MIRSAKEKVSYTWPKIRLAALRASAMAVKISESQTCLSTMYDNIYLLNITDQTHASEDNSTHSEGSITTNGDSEDSDSVFDPSIPPVTILLEVENSSSKLSVNSKHSENLSDCGDDDVFT